MTYKIAVIENEESLRPFLARFFRESDVAVQIFCFSDGEEFIRNDPGGFHLAMVGISQRRGMEAAARIRAYDADLPIILTADNDRYAIEGYAIDAMDYLLKPIAYSEFQRKMQRAVEKMDRRKRGSVCYRKGKAFHRFSFEEVLYFESVGQKLQVHTVDKIYENYGKIGQTEQELDGSGFVRCNQCYLVNLEKVDRVQNDYVYIGGETLKISRSRKKAFMEALTSYARHMITV